MLRQLCFSIVSRSRSVPSLRNISNVAIGKRTVTVPSVGSSGNITLDVYTSSNGNLPSSRNERVIIYLRDGLESATRNDNYDETNRAHSPLLPAELARAAQASVVQINYRLSADHHYPIPVYDVLTGYDWVVRNLSPKRQPQISSDFSTIDHDYNASQALEDKKSQQQPRVGVYGEMIGGSLALMLAMTECKIGDDARIAAAVVKSPVVDWTFAEPSVPKSSGSMKRLGMKRSSKQVVEEEIMYKEQLLIDSNITSDTVAHPQLTVSDFNRLRNSVFPRRKPDAHFSPFASPIHFLRTSAVPIPGRALPNDMPAPARTLSFPSDTDVDTEFALLANLEDESIKAYPMSPGSLNTHHSHSNEDLETRLQDLNLASSIKSDVDHEVNKPTIETEANAAEHLSYAPSLTKRYRIPLRYPPSGTEPGLLPDMLFIVDKATSEQTSSSVEDETESNDNKDAMTLLRSQGEEMVKLLRRAWSKWGIGAILGARLQDQYGRVSPEAADSEEEEDESLDDTVSTIKPVINKETKAQLDALAGAKIALEHHDSPEETERIGKWFKTALDRDGVEEEQLALVQQRKPSRRRSM